jgi:hypothetical protein
MYFTSIQFLGRPGHLKTIQIWIFNNFSAGTSDLTTQVLWTFVSLVMFSVSCSAVVSTNYCSPSHNQMDWYSYRGIRQYNWTASRTQWRPPNSVRAGTFSLTTQSLPKIWNSRNCCFIASSMNNRLFYQVISKGTSLWCQNHRFCFLAIRYNIITYLITEHNLTISITCQNGRNFYFLYVL